MIRFSTIAKATVLAALIGAAGLGFRYVTAPAYDGAAGIAYGKAFAPARGQDVKFHIWYPAQPGGRAVTVGGNGVFHGTPAGKGAPHRPGKHPMVIMSHGAGGNAGQFGWIASALAARGYVVVLPNHPGTTSGNASAQEAVKLWKRPADLSAVIDAIVAAPEVYPFIDTNRIATLGFSAGGYTSIALTGAIVDPDRLQRFCDDGKTGMSDCTYLARGGVDLHKMDLSPAAQDHRDARVRTAVIVDPGTVNTLTEDSLAAIDIPMLIINLGAEGRIPRAVNAKAAAALIPQARYAVVPDALHFSFLAQCKPRGAKILANEGELDPLCDDAGGRGRAALHVQFVQMIADYLDAQLAG